ncbi:hypothetical protein [Streptomyces sp. NPDC090022]|uniref:hypothetical protein n=1 Tax=Streptomyces sp. NPDC090022 TaxID=3365920 RepID=UPI0037F303BA
MRRGLVHAFAWTLATGAAVTLSWWGVHTVMSGTAYDRPLAVPLTTQALSSATQGTRPPAPSASPGTAAPSAPAPSAPPSASASAASRPPAAAKPAPSRQPYGGGPAKEGTGDVKGYTVPGGRVVFDLGATSAELVSATPAAGWRMQVWKQPFMIRVTFTRDGRESSVFCTWHDHPPLVEFDER